MSNTHEALVVRIGEITPHPNADKLELTQINGYQMVIGKGSFKTGDLAVFVQPDSVVPQTEPFKFIWGVYAAEQLGLPGVPTERPFDGVWEYQTVVPEAKRRIKPKRLRKEWSEGLLVPVSEFTELHEFTIGLGMIAKEGDDVADKLGITHYVPEFDKESTVANNSAKPRLRRPRTLKGWFYFVLYRLGFKGAHKSYAQAVTFNAPVYDVNSFKQSRNRFEADDIVHVSEKIHGSNARYIVYDDVFYAGSHEQWKTKEPSNVWWRAAEQHPEIEEWCWAHPGKVLYGEVGPTQPGFRYGCDDGEVFFFSFDVYDPETGTYDWAGNQGMGLNAPPLYHGRYDEAAIKALVDGQSTVPHAKNIREGVVIRTTNRPGHQLKLKLVSNDYLTKKG